MTKWGTSLDSNKDDSKRNSSIISFMFEFHGASLHDKFSDCNISAAICLLRLHCVMYYFIKSHSLLNQGFTTQTTLHVSPEPTVCALVDERS